ncbi:MAG: 16S rRNA (cytidine(1402)-2'-O)-methyltransferase [Deltaproteobacteria bacterium]|nr:MAG: 16S rRNA (cytidine(1402)-2'-O)-methyltransferase [Deltaproteobacteria bacterium]RLC13554.1 MAG: 16S rRNA (cytidine(1402)-2'-O)-methyltransferase [Deltaproteobacteria bacterium]
MDENYNHTALNSTVNGILYVVATPIGNMADITFRAIQTLKDVALIAAEDTRHTNRLLTHYAIRNSMISLHEHNENQRTGMLVKRLVSGESIALVSDAGTPTLSDPGYRLIKEAIASGIRIVPIPGASAVLASLCASGLPTDAYVFMGFLPRKEGKRQKILKSLAGEKKTLIFYESPRRIKVLINDMIKTLGNRQGVLSREMTKRHEEFVRGTLWEILDVLAGRPEIKGECTLVVKGAAGQEIPDVDTLREEIIQGLHSDGFRLSSLVKSIADRYGLPKKQIYAEALKIKSLHDVIERDHVVPKGE